MKKVKYIVYSSFILFVILITYACVEDEIYTDSAPTVMYPTDELYVDLNNIQPPIICVVNSKNGLKSVEMFIVKEGENGEEIEEVLGKPITSFYSPHVCSVKETPLFTIDMLYFKLIATDVAGLVTVSKYKFNIDAMAGLPVILFSYDEAGEDVITTALDYIEDSETPDLFVHVSSTDDLKTLTLFETSQSSTNEFAIVNFEPGVKKAVFNMMTINGARHIFSKGTTAIRAKVIAGKLKKERESSISIKYRNLITFIVDQDQENLNGLVAGSTYSVTGTLDVVNGIDNFSYTLLDKKGAVIQSEKQINMLDETNFKVDFIASNTLGFVKLAATDFTGKVNTIEIDVHVGYKYYYLMAGPSAGGSFDSFGLFFSAQKGMIMSYCDAKDNAQFIDGGFIADEDAGTISFGNLASVPDLFNPSFTDCKLSTWSSYSTRNVGKSVIKSRNFDQTGINDFINEAVNNENSVSLFRNLKGTAPLSSGNVAIYETVVDGATKKVIVCIDKVITHNASAPAETTFWAKFKVEL